MVLTLARALDVPLRERNQLLLAAGYAPQYRQSGLDEDVDGSGARGAGIGSSRTTSPTRPW